LERTSKTSHVATRLVW